MKIEYEKVSVEIMGMDCTNNGVTSGHERALLVYDKKPSDKQFKHEEVESDLPILKLKYGRGNRKFIAIPFNESDDAYPQFGGHFIYSSDSRFPSDSPIHVHDRFEWHKYMAIGNVMYVEG